MPEGPEAASIRKFINKEFVNNTLISVTILKGRYINHGPPKNFKEFTHELPLKVINVEKKGKVIFIYFENNWCIISKLGMTGWWYSTKKPSWRSEVKTVEFHFKNKTTLIYSDPRSYGTLTFTKDPELVKNELLQIAPDIMTKSTILQLFLKYAQNIIEKKPHMPIEELLSNQKLVISGIGNYLKSEILYASKIAPMRQIDSITQGEWKLLYKNAKQISAYMTKALQSNNIDAYESSMYVYSKKHDPSGNTVKTYSNAHGRTVHWVPEVQK